MSKKNLLVIAGALIVVLIGYFFFKDDAGSDASVIMADVKQGEFKVEIETTGELEAKNSVNIMGPSALRDFRIFEVTIQSIIDEGVVVKKGDWVANLDRSDFQGKFSDKQIELEKANSKYTQTQLDT
ncbi:MAG TPA: RND transporter, partial [Cyclobacteriaceae bacterium]|nr:RND transporter [Cyclobacteriaceae bacterium]